MEQRYLIDTNVLIDFFNARLTENAKVLLFSIEPLISAITHIELFSSKNISQAEIVSLKHFIKNATVYTNLSEEIIEKTIEIRLHTKMKTPDAIIAATAIVNGLTVLTRNLKDFQKIEGLRLLDPYTI